MKKYLVMSLVFAFVLTSFSTAFAANLVIRPLSVVGTDGGAYPSGYPDSRCVAGGTQDGIALFEAKGSGNVVIKLKIYDASGAFNSGYSLGTYYLAPGASWVYYYIEATGGSSIPCISSGVYKVVVEFKTPHNGIIKTVSTKVRVL